MNVRSKNSGKKQPKGDYRIGYARPPRDTQYKPGQSGNRKGRPKGSKDMHSEMRKVYLDPVPMTVKGKKRRVPTIVAIELTQAKRGFTDGRAAQAVFKNAREFGIFDQNEAEASSPSHALSDEFIERLSDRGLDELIRIEEELQAEKRNPKKPH